MAARFVLVTRPEPGASATAARVAAMGFSPILAPMLLNRPRAAPLPPATAIGAVVVTSAAAPPLLPAALWAARLFAVGDATAEAARGAGFSNIESAGADAAALAALIAARADRRDGPLLLVTAAGQGQRLAADLRARGYRVLRRAVYETRAATRLPEAALAALDAGEISRALVFSPATGRALAAALRRSGRGARAGDIDALAISPAAAEALASLPWRSILIAARPNQEELLGLLGVSGGPRHPQRFT